MARVVLNRVTNFTESEKQRLIEVIPMLEKAVNSVDFFERVRFYAYEQVKSYTMGHSGEQVYNSIMNGNEKLSGVSDYEIDIDLTIYTVPWYKSGKSVIGYTYPSTLRTWINRAFFRSFTHAEIAGNLMHEYCHKLGYGHSFNWTPSRKDSVPYAVGNIVKDIVNKHQEAK
jgi:hypothetical protein